MSDNGVEAEERMVLSPKFKQTLLQIIDLDFNETVELVNTIVEADFWTGRIE